MGSNDFGVKISQVGWDIQRAGDSNLYFSSSWPILKIEKTDTVNLGANASFNIPHNLNYPPLALIWNDTSGLVACQSTASNITIPSTAPSYANSKIRYFIFRLPLNRAYQSPVIKATPQPPGGANHNFGLKFVKDGKDINSKDYRDYTVHSSTRSPLLHAVIYDKISPIGDGLFAAVKGLKWKPDLPYKPVYFAFYSSDGATYIPLSVVAQTPPKVNNDADGGIVINALGLSGFGSIVVLKDPLDGLTRTEVKI